MMNAKFILCALAIFVSINMILAEIPQVDISNPTTSSTSGIPNVIIKIPTTPVNYSLINVNNSQYLQGLTPQQVANLFIETDPFYHSNTLSYCNSTNGFCNALYYPYSNPLGYYNSTTLPASGMDYTNIAMLNQSNNFTGGNITQNGNLVCDASGNCGTYNSTYDKWAYNQTTATYNLYNNIWSSTFNSTYDAKVSFDKTNVAYVNQTNSFTQNNTFYNSTITFDNSTIFINNSKKGITINTPEYWSAGTSYGLRINEPNTTHGNHIEIGFSSIGPGIGVINTPRTYWAFNDVLAFDISSTSWSLSNNYPLSWLSANQLERGLIKFTQQGSGNAMAIGVSSSSTANHPRSLILSDYSDIFGTPYNFGHPANLTDPTLFIQSNNESKTQWLGLWHNTSSAIIQSGNGSIILMPNNSIVDIFGSLRIPSDTNKLLLGSLQQSSIMYNNSDMLINPKEVGAGKVYVQGQLEAQNYSINGNVGLTYSYSMLNSSSSQCWMNYTGGILTWSNC